MKCILKNESFVSLTPNMKPLSTYLLKYNMTNIFQKICFNFLHKGTKELSSILRIPRS